MLARLIAVFIDEVRRELRKFDDRPEPESAQDVSATTVDTDFSDQDEPGELRDNLRIGFATATTAAEQGRPTRT